MTGALVATVNCGSGGFSSAGHGFQWLNFGRHRGRHIDQVDDCYFQWIVNNCPEADSWCKVAASALTSRRKIMQSRLLSDLKCCTRSRDLQKGRRVHAKAVEAGIDFNIYVAAALTSMYAKCNSMADARTVFDSIQEADVVCWNALILGYADNGQGLVALDLFSRMKDEGRVAPDSSTYLAALKACTSLAVDEGEAGKGGYLERGKQIHSEIGRHMNHFVQSTLINLYAKCGSIIDARIVFDSVQDPDVVSWNTLILGYADNGQGVAAIDLFSRMKEDGRCAPDSFTYLAALKACTSLAEDGGKAECLERGRQIHSDIGGHMDLFVQCTLINLYAKCGSMQDARTVFDSIQEPNVVCWSSIILGYADNKQGIVAFDLFIRMKDEGRCAPDSSTYVAALKACTSLAADGGEAGKRRCLERARRIHLDIGCSMDDFVQNTLINLYAKCDSMVDARAVFDTIQQPDVVSWTALIQGYADNGQGLVAFDIFSMMKEDGRCAPNSLTYVAALKACTSLAADGGESVKRLCLERSRQIRSEIGPNIEHFVQSTLINLYAKCCSMEDAREMFDSIPEPDVVSWNALILGYVDNGQGLVALDLFSRMKEEGKCAPDSLTYLAALVACCSIGALASGRRIHSAIRKFDSQLVICLVDFYAKCGSMEEAREVFDLHPRVRDVSTWTALLAGYARFGDTNSVFKLFEEMQDQGIQPDAVTFVCMISCCSHAGLIAKAWEYLEVMPTQYGVTPTVMHYNCMIDLLGRANKLNEAVALLQKMPCHPDAVTWNTLLGACRKWKNVEIGKWAFKCSMDFDQKNAPAYVLMAEIYGSRGMWEEQERVLQTKLKFGTSKLEVIAESMDIIKVPTFKQ